MVYERSPSLGSLIEVFNEKQVTVQTREGKVKGVLRFSLSTSVRLIIATEKGLVLVANWTKISTVPGEVKNQ